MKKITFATDNKYLLDFPELHPQPARNFLPKWYKDLPVNARGGEGLNKYVPKKINLSRTVKTCPSFMEVFNEGYVFVAPCDIWIRVEDNGEWEWKTASVGFELAEHGNFQMVDSLPNKPIKQILKLVNPWHIFTPKGYSCRQLPMMHHYNPDWYIPYGVLKTDVHYEAHQQICVTSKDNEILIKRGEPLNYIVPYKREKFSMEVVDGTEGKYLDKIQSTKLYISSSFRSNYHKFTDKER